MREIADSGSDSSKERYDELKKREAGTNQNEAEKRFEELKQEAKEEFVERQERREKEREKEEQRDSGDFITY